MNLQQLRYLVATADHGTMTRAAAECLVAQPALTRSVRGLEREIGLALFRRRGRGVELTDEGRVVVAAARRALAEITAIEEHSRAAARRATLTLAATPSIQADLGSGLLSDFRRRHPRFPVRIHPCTSAEDVGDAVAAGRADAGVADLPTSAGVVAVAFEIREVVVIAPPDSGLPDPLPIPALDRVPLVLPARGSDRRRAIELMFGELGLRLEVAFESDERSSWIPAVLAGFGSCLWYRTRGTEAALHGARVLALDPPVFRSIAVLHRDEQLSPPVAGLVALATERAAAAAPVPGR